MHGGSTPSGVALPQFKQGRYSKHLPARLAARYTEAQNDPDLVSLHDDIALVDTRLSEVVEQVSDDDPRLLWGQVQTALGQYEEAQKRGSRDQVAALTRVHELIAQGLTGGGSTWREVIALLEQRRRLVESESKRLQTLQQMIPAESALLLIGLIERIIKKYVIQPEQLAAIAAELAQLATLPAGRIIDAE